MLILTIIRREAGLLAFLFLSPFYTILRESSDGSIIFYLWPYVIIASLIMIIIAEYVWKKTDWEINKKNIAGAGILCLMIGPVFWLAVDTSLFEALFQSDKSLFFTQLTSRNLAVMLIPVMLVLVGFFYVYFHVMKSRERSVNIVDVSIAAFFWYGIFAIFYSYTLTGSIVTGLDGFRYYFLMSIVYFLCRYLIVAGRHLKIIISGFALVFVLAALFTLLESYCMNCLNIAFRDLPWSGLLFSEFSYDPYTADENAFMNGGYTPMGLIRMTHLSGFFLLIGFLLYLAMALGQSFSKNRIKTIGMWLLVGILPIGFIFTSRTVLIIFLVGVLVTVIVSKQSLRKSLVSSCIILFIIPYLYSYHFLPGISFDIKSQIGFLATKSSHGSNAFMNMIKMMGKDFVYFKSATEVQKDKSATEVQKDKPATEVQKGWHKFILGTGYAVTDWVKRYGSKESKVYTLGDTSDSYYLKVMKQFGITGLFILLSIGILLAVKSIRFICLARDYPYKNVFIGISVVLLAVFISLIHLGPLFKTGLNTVIYMFMAIMVSGEGFVSKTKSV